VLHIGRDVCGQHEFVHDGLLTTIVDESLARCCFPALPNRIGVTANLNIDFLKQIPADSYLLVKVRTINGSNFLTIGENGTARGTKSMG
jgi:acyl-coenzyme A thioesterase PaaI-like protein